MSKYGLLISPDYVEDTVSTALQMYLTMISFPFGRHGVVHFSKKKERVYGSDVYIADLRRHRILPFYLQFKRPFGYPINSRSKVITERESLGANVFPKSLYFELRKKTPKQKDLQHNVLFGLNSNNPIKGCDKAVYVCPLFFDKTEYFLSMHLSGLGRFWRDPFYFQDREILTPDGNVNFQKLPTLPRHVTIQPHKRVNTAKHKYSFDEYGNDICFHSPKRLEKENLNLANYLMAVQEEFTSGDFHVNSDNALEYLQILSEPFDDFLIDKEFSLLSWLYFGDYLKENFGIEQFAFLGER